MGKDIRLLDCTLRDGGYINDWNFGHSVITGTYKRLEKAGVEFIEVGFLNDSREYDRDYSIQPDTSAFDKLFEGVSKGNAIPVAMVDFGSCDISNIRNCENSFIDGIRVIFKKEKIEQALPFCREIKEKGYKLFIQAISVTAYSDLEMLNYIEKINEIKPFAFSIVDTYGLLDGRKLTNYFNLLNNNLNPEINIGYHAHNNFQLAFSNSMKFVALETDRTVIVDSTVYGMGKSAGNCPSELISMHLNQRYKKAYNINQILEILDTDLMSVYKHNYWGYKYNFYLSAMQNCHPNYVQYLLERKTLSVSSINEILSQIPYEKKLLFDEGYIKESYFAYQENSIDDFEAINSLKNKLEEKNIVILGPGETLGKDKDIIKQFIKEYNAVTISTNFEPRDFKCDYVFISNAKRYSKYIDEKNYESFAKLIITSNITDYDQLADYILNYKSLLEEEAKSDNSLLLLLSLLQRMNVNSVNLAGFDGFSHEHPNYYESKYLFADSEEYVIKNNENILKQLAKMNHRLKMNFITKSLYEKIISEE